MRQGEALQRPQQTVTTRGALGSGERVVARSGRAGKPVVNRLAKTVERHRLDRYGRYL